MSCSEFDEHIDRIETCILGQSPGDYLESVCKGFDCELGTATDRRSIFAQA